MSLTPYYGPQSKLRELLADTLTKMVLRLRSFESQCDTAEERSKYVVLVADMMHNVPYHLRGDDELSRFSVDYFLHVPRAYQNEESSFGFDCREIVMRFEALP